MNIGIGIAIFLVSAIIFTFVGFFARKKIAESKLKSAENEAKRIIESAQKEAENTKKEEIYKAQEEIMKSRKDLDDEIRERRGEVQSQEKRLIQKEENLENRISQLERKEKNLEAELDAADRKQAELDELYNKEMQELQHVANLSVDEAKRKLLDEVEKQITNEKAAIIRDLEQKTKETAEKTAKNIIGYAIQKCAADHSQETTVSIVSLPNDDMKGRIIGREGRNIKTLETLTGVDLIIDDTPEAVVISGFDPLRREVAKMALEKLIDDGRIHPAKIE